MYKKYLNSAIELERKGHFIFEKLQKKAQDQETKKLFTVLAKEELSHIKEINKILAIETKTLETEDHDILNELKKIIDSVNTEEEISSIKHGVTLAKNFEQAVVKLYTFALEKTLDPENQKFFEKMIKFETIHYEKLQKLLSHLN